MRGFSRFGLGLLAAAAFAFASAFSIQVFARQDAAPVQAPSPAATPITDGPTLFKLRGCAQCHEIRGEGGNKGPDLSGVGRRLKPDAIHIQIAHGSDAMPAFGEAIPAEEVDALTRYLHTLRDKTRKSANTAPQPTSSHSPE